jgi:Ca2+-binding EF-hand superfamily protein
MQVFEETFQIFDKDCDGFITLTEIRTVMNALGFQPCDEDIRKGIKDIDNDSHLNLIIYFFSSLLFVILFIFMLKIR